MGNLEVEVLPYSSEKLSYVGILIPQGSKLSEPGGGTQIHDFGPYVTCSRRGIGIYVVEAQTYRSRADRA